MCGLIAAFGAQPVDVDAFQRGIDQMARRGPDDEGLWQSESVLLGHRRLAILDLDFRGAQPLHSACGRYVIVFNGEIYNFRDLRRDLERAGSVFHTQSDTEVLLELYVHERERMLPKLRGMFAFVIWDKVAKRAFAARDPYGIKPLYLARAGDGWLLASQVKALLATGLISIAPDPAGQAGFWLLGSVPEPYTWYRDIRALPAGSWCRIGADQQLDGPHTWFDIGDCWRDAPACNLAAKEAGERVRTAVLESVRQHLVADVPVGVLLSGGIDSGSLAGLMKDAGAANIKGVTVAFSEFAGTHQDESPAAEQVARQYGIEHHVRIVTRAEFNADLPRIVAAMDQPSIDGINTWYAGKAVAELGLNVVISGVGGDELFYGYSSFRQLPALVSRWRRLTMIPGARTGASALTGLLARRSGNPRWRWLTRQADSLYGAYWLRRGLFSPDQLPALMGQEAAQDPALEVVPACLLEAMAGTLPQDPMAAVGQLESKVYLRNQLLRDSDWASMDHSVELRTPLVDAWLLRDLAPLLRCFARVSGKTLLANSPASPLPLAIVNRHKTGFGIPVEQWTNNGLHNTNEERGSRGWARRLAATYNRACE